MATYIDYPSDEAMILVELHKAVSGAVWSAPTQGTNDMINTIQSMLAQRLCEISLIAAQNAGIGTPETSAMAPSETTENTSSTPASTDTAS